MTTWNDIDIALAKEAVSTLKEGDSAGFKRWLPAVEQMEDFFNKLELLKQKEIKVCRILQKP